MSEGGIVFFASGARYVEQGFRAARRSMQHNDVPHLVFCSEPPPDGGNCSYELFTPTKNVWMDRLACYMRSPFDRTLFLDVDCSVLAPIVGIFELLDVYELAAAHAPGYRGLLDPQVPRAFFELNCGVIACKKSDRTHEMLGAWRDLYRTWYVNPPFPGAAFLDQPAFRHVVWKFKIPIYVLGPEYNWRPSFRSFLVEAPKILHGYHHDPESIAAEAARLGYGAMPPLMPHLTDLEPAVGAVM